MKHHPYEYTAEVVRVIDGDTVELDVDLGFNIRARETFRLAGINAPELRKTKPGEEPSSGEKAMLGLSAMLLTQQDDVTGFCPVRILTGKRDKYGRWLATIFVGDAFDVNVNETMIERGFAVPYDGGKR